VRGKLSGQGGFYPFSAPDSAGCFGFKKSIFRETGRPPAADH
jgi:hypothetical protein